MQIRSLATKSRTSGGGGGEGGGGGGKLAYNEHT